MEDRWSTAECDLMVALCRYNAQILYSVRNKLMGNDHPMVPLVGDVVPAGTQLSDGAVKLYKFAALTLVQCGVATAQGDSYTLRINTDKIAIDPLTAPSGHRQDIGKALEDVFRIYKDFEVLGPPESLQQLLDLLLPAGFTEMRHGFLEWSEKGRATIFRDGPLRERSADDSILWAPELFGWHVQEAALQWQGGLALDPVNR